MSSHDQPHRKKEHLSDFLDNRIEGVGEDALKGHPTFRERIYNTAKTRLREHDTGRGLGNVGRGRNRDSHLRLAQSRRVICAVTAHRNQVAAVLEGLYKFILFFGQNAGEDREFLGLNIVANRARWTNGSGKSDRPRHDRGGCRRIAGNHHGTHAQRTNLCNQRRRVGPRRIAQRDQACQAHRRRRADSDSKQPEALGFEFFRGNGHGRQWWRKADHGGISTLHYSDSALARIRRGGFGGLLCGSKAMNLISLGRLAETWREATERMAASTGS